MVVVAVVGSVGVVMSRKLDLSLANQTNAPTHKSSKKMAIAQTAPSTQDPKIVAEYAHPINALFEKNFSEMELAKPVMILLGLQKKTPNNVYTHARMLKNS